MTEMNMGQLASKLILSAKKVGPVTDQKVATLAQVAVGYVKTAIQQVHAVDTGSMLNSTSADKVGDKTYLVGPTVTYAPYVALGTSRMAARPFHLIAKRKLQEAINQDNLLGDIGL